MSCQVRAAEAAPHERHPIFRYAVSPRLEIATGRVRDATVEWTADRGLTVRPSGPAPQVELPAPLALAQDGESLVRIEVSAAPPGELELAWQDDACSGDGDACRVRTPLSDELPQEVVFELAGKLRGRAAALRLSVPPGGATTIRSVRVGSEPDPPGEGRAFPLLTAARPARVIVQHGVSTRLAPGEGLRVAFTEPAPGTPPDPFLGIAAGVDADKAGSLAVEGDGLPEGDYEVFFTNRDCPHFQERCKVPGRRVADELVLADPSTSPAWRGRIEALRIDFPESAQGETTLRAVRFVTRTELAELRAKLGAGETARSSDGWLGWKLGLGTVLECRFGDESFAEREPPLALRAAISGQDKSGIRFAGLRAEWVLADGSRAAALDHVTSLASSTGKTRSFPLVPPEGPVQALEVRVGCAQNCSAPGATRLAGFVGRPLYRYRPADAEGAAAAPPNLLFVSVDTLRADRLSLYGHDSPTDRFLAELAGRATLFERVYAVDTWTVPTHAALFTGRYPAPGADVPAGVPRDQSTLAEVLARLGYRTIALTDGVLMSAKKGLDRGFDLFAESFEPIDRKVERLEQLLAEAEAAQVPTFALLHTYEVHAPYSLPAGAATRSVFAGPAAATFPISSDELGVAKLPDTHPFLGAARRYVRALYDASIEQVDRSLKSLLTAPRLASFLQNAVIVVTSDHGEELLDRGRLGHGNHLPYADQIHVPLLMKKPGQTTGARVPDILSQVDVPSLILDALGWPDLLGRDPCARSGIAFAVSTGKGDPAFPRKSHLALGVKGDGFLRIEVRRRDGGELAFAWAEPSEADAAAGLDGAAETALLDELVECLRARTSAAEPSEAEPPDALGPDRREQLRALGYIEE